MKRVAATTPSASSDDDENRSVELEVADVLLRLQHKDHRHKDQRTTVASTTDHYTPPRRDRSTTMRRLLASSSSPLCSSVRGDDGAPETRAREVVAIETSLSSQPPLPPQQYGWHSSPEHSTATTTTKALMTTTPPTAMQLRQRLGIDFLLNHPAAAPAASASGADPQKIKRVEYIVIADVEREETDDCDDGDDEGETSTQPDRSSEEDDDDAVHATDIGGELRLLVAAPPSARRGPRRLIAKPEPTAIIAQAHNTAQKERTDSTARRFLNEKLRQRLEDKRRRGALPEAQARATPTAEDDDHAMRAAWATQGDLRSGRSSAGGKLSTAHGRRGVATRKELDIWEQLMLTSVIQPLLPAPSSSSSGAAPSTSTANTSTSSSRSFLHTSSHGASPHSITPAHSSSSSSPSRPSRQDYQQPQAAAPVACACTEASAPYYPAHYYYCHQGSPRMGGSPPPLPPTATASGSGVTSSFPGSFQPRAPEEERKRKRELRKSESEGGYCGDDRRRYEPADEYYRSPYYRYDHSLYPGPPDYYPPSEPVYDARETHRYHDQQRRHQSDSSSKRRRGHSPVCAPSDSASLVFHHFAAVDESE